MPFLPSPPLAERARWAVALYSNMIEYGKEAAYEKDRRAGIRRYKNASSARLRSDLEPVLKAYPDGTVQHSAAAYVLARYGVDVEQNIERLFESAHMGGQRFVWGNQEALPEALADLWEVRRSPSALRHLVTMPSDGHVGEEQADNLARVLRLTPDAVLRAACKSKEGWSQLVLGVDVRRLPKAKDVTEKGLLARLRRDVRKFAEL